MMLEGKSKIKKIYIFLSMEKETGSVFFFRGKECEEKKEEDNSCASY